MDIVNISRNDLSHQDRRSLGSLTFVENGNVQNDSRCRYRIVEGVEGEWLSFSYNSRASHLGRWAIVIESRPVRLKRLHAVLLMDQCQSICSAIRPASKRNSGYSKIIRLVSRPVVMFRDSV